MMNLPQHVPGITHPLIRDIYLKKDFGPEDQRGHHNEDVLVIETVRPDADDDYEMFDSYLIDLLGDLQELQAQAEKKIGRFDRIDIRTH